MPVLFRIFSLLEGMDRWLCKHLGSCTKEVTRDDKPLGLLLARQLLLEPLGMNVLAGLDRFGQVLDDIEHAEQFVTTELCNRPVSMILNIDMSKQWGWVAA